MKLSKCFKLAVGSIVSNKMRSFLTMLGIIIGIAAVIALVSVMNGVTGQVTETFSKMGTTKINVSVQNRGLSRVVTPDDIYEFAQDNELIDGVSPNVTVPASVKGSSSSDSLSSKVTGVSEQYAEKNKYELKEGTFFSYVDVLNLQKVCTIGTYVANEIFGNEPATGKTLKINGYAFKVTGVIVEQADSTEGSTDDCVYIPYTSATRLSRSTLVSSYTMWAKDDDSVDAAITSIKTYLNIFIGDSDYYSVVGMQEILDDVSSVTETLKMALVLIAGISLLVGGIGIMKIMLVSVTERTKEIGIRKSLGANPHDIMKQFVIEAATISCLGGLIGIILGSLISTVVGMFMGTSVTTSVTAVAVSFAVSAGIGIGFGYLPAKKASALNPIDALRFE